MLDDGTNTYTFDYLYESRGNIREMDVLSGGSVQQQNYTYNAQGQRLTKTVGSETITYHYFNGTVLYETKSGDANNILHVPYFRAAQGKLLAVSLNYDITTPASNAWYYYHYTAHGDVTVVTDGNGNIFREYLYDPYGNILSVKDGSGSAITDLGVYPYNSGKGWVPYTLSIREFEFPWDFEQTWVMIDGQPELRMFVE